MKRNHLKGLDKKRLRRWLLIFFLSLAIPTAVLIQQSYSRLRWETFHQHQLMAEELTHRINNRLIRLINSEEQRPFTDYSFLNVAGAPTVNFLQRSPLSQYPIPAEIPGLIGYFQVDAGGKLLTPFLPEDIEKVGSYGIAEQELSERAALQNRIRQILNENHLVRNQKVVAGKNDKEVRGNLADRTDKGLSENEKGAVSLDSSLGGSKLEKPAAPSANEGQAVFDELNKISPGKRKQENKLGRLEDIKLRQTFQKKASQLKREESYQVPLKATPKKARTEQNVLPESIQRAKKSSGYELEESNRPITSTVQPEVQASRIRTFESAVDPFEFSQLDSGHFVLFRKAWLNGQRYIQGLLIEKDAFLQGNINAEFQETTLSQMSDLLVVFQGNVLSAFAGRTPRGYLSSTTELEGELLYQDQLFDPFSELQLVFSITQLPVGPGGWVIIWLTLVLTVVFSAGFYWMYRLGVGQINLVNQQQDFVSAVSHELKTPLTSIRMYGEMLQAGWADEVKKKTYYDFILDESERLSRLINNVLQLAKMTRNEKKPELKSLTAAELMDNLQSKISTQIERGGFCLRLSCDQDADQARIKVNPDWFIQIMINLVDNAIKFSAKADTKTIELSCHRLSSGLIQFGVRDYGPGIAKDQLKKIFKLFYRAENELTRETVGTGIGLALAHQMIVTMNGRIDVTNRNPGAEFRIDFPVEKSTENIRVIHRPKSS
ncbi:HAMP domain-containing sensor histidine kinase [Methylomicrobium sp. Wu6]|uniref:sensor histidine kinase n=1 Tax=Methylomicrobium sp. Wu6 TaxID=3107928 RepID=UPI002DD68920|nr:HAMP domain-containing sensor histidine kinase [Methylomicrobium sp. Wu6]MEC4746977.1 HAMP domain-containing sensor histidine kinase [Methylomicrobium sp. Wu6]